MPDSVECPCCKGKGILIVEDSELKAAVPYICTHCIGHKVVFLDNRSNSRSTVEKPRDDN